MDPIRIVEAFAIVVLGSWAAIKERGDRNKRKREKILTLKYGLAGNPKRCEDHEERLRAIEKQGASIITNLAVLTTKFDSVDRKFDSVDRWKNNINELFNSGSSK